MKLTMLQALLLACFCFGFTAAAEETRVEVKALPAGFGPSVSAQKLNYKLSAYAQDADGSFIGCGVMSKYRKSVFYIPNSALELSADEVSAAYSSCVKQGNAALAAVKAKAPAAPETPATNAGVKGGKQTTAPSADANTITGLRSELAKAEALVAKAEREKQDAQRLMAQAQQERDEARRLAAGKKGDSGNAAREVEKIKREAQTQIGQVRQEAEAKVNQTKADAEKSRQQLQAQLEQARREAEAKANQAKAEADQARTELAKTKNELEQKNRELQARGNANNNSQVAELQASVERLNREVENMRHERDDLKQKLDAANVRVGELEKKSASGGGKIPEKPQGSLWVKLGIKRQRYVDVPDVKQRAEAEAIAAHLRNDYDLDARRFCGDLVAAIKKDRNNAIYNGGSVFALPPAHSDECEELVAKVEATKKAWVEELNSAGMAWWSGCGGFVLLVGMPVALFRKKIRQFVPQLPPWMQDQHGPSLPRRVQKSLVEYWNIMFPPRRAQKQMQMGSITVTPLLPAPEEPVLVQSGNNRLSTDTPGTLPVQPTPTKPTNGKRTGILVRINAELVAKRLDAGGLSYSKVARQPDGSMRVYAKPEQLDPLMSALFHEFRHLVVRGSMAKSLRGEEAYVRFIPLTE